MFIISSVELAIYIEEYVPIITPAIRAKENQTVFLLQIKLKILKLIRQLMKLLMFLIKFG